MSDDPINGAGQWAASDFTELNQAIGMLGLQYLPIIAGKPPIGIDLSGVAILTLLGKWANPLMEARRTAMEAASADYEATPEPTPTDIVALLRASAEYDDSVLEAVVREPPYQTMASVQRDGVQPGHLHVLAFSLTERLAVRRLINGGAEALATFRGDPAGFIAGPALPGVPSEPGPGSDPAGAAPPEVLAERGDLAPGADVGSRGAGGSSPRARRAS